MNRRDRSRLTTALDSLPAELSHLRGPILDISKQDAELLGCGEADATSLDEAVWPADGSRPLAGLAAANALREWLGTQDDAEGAWAAPVVFVESYLRGMELFGDGEQPAPMPAGAPTGLQRVTVDVPPKMKAKQHAGGLELSDRNVRIFVLELDDPTYRIRAEEAQRAASPEWLASLPPQFAQPHLRVALDADFRIASARSGLKFTQRDAASCRLQMVAYLFDLGGAKVEATIFSRKKPGGDLDAYEPLVASLRMK